MSKRGSRNAINFAGKNWSVGRKSLKSKKKKTKSINKQKERDKRRERNFNRICKKFDFEKTDENKIVYEKLLKKFIEIKGSKIAKRSFENIEYFKSFCAKYKTEFNIEIYFKEHYNSLNFPKRFPEIKKEKSELIKNPKRKINNHKAKNRNTFSNLVSEETLLKLKKVMKQ
jgi:hypothetical protein